MLDGYGDDDNPPAGCGGGRATRSSSKRPGSAAQEGWQNQTKRARSHLQTPPRPLAAAAPAESLQHQRTQRPRPPPVKPIYFIQEYSQDPEETVAEVNAGGTRFSLPRSALQPLMRSGSFEFGSIDLFSAPVLVSLPHPPNTYAAPAP